MQSLVNTNFNRTYNPSRQNALSNIKRLLTSRDTATQNQACGYLIDVISRNKSNNIPIVEYLLESDITVFLCEATSNLDFTLFRSILSCLRLLWSETRFFSDEHAAHAMTAVLRALAHYAGSGSRAPLDACLHFLCDLLNGITANNTTPPLSHQSAYSATQLLACLNSLSQHMNTNPDTILPSALVLHALISYQPDNLTLNVATAKALAEVLSKWFVLLMGSLNHSTLMGEGSGMIFVVICQLGMEVLRLIKLLNAEQKADFVRSILADDQEATALKQCAVEMGHSVRKAMGEIVVFVRDHQDEIPTEEYNVFLKFLLNYFYDNTNSECLPDFCDMLFSRGYLIMLPKAQITRNDVSVRKVSTLILGEMLKVLSDKYLSVNIEQRIGETCAKDIHMGLFELQYGIEKPQRIGYQLQKGQPYSLLIYIYFYCQSSENPEEAMAPLLPHLIEHVLKLPKTFEPPKYIIKALWLVFAMSTISNGSLESLDQRVYLEKATERLVSMLRPEPAIYYTHNPAILLWAFTSLRIPNYIRLQVLSQWLKIEESLPTDLTTQPMVWELLLNILTQCKEKTIVENCIAALQTCVDDGDERTKHEFTLMLWSLVPSVLSRALIDSEGDGDINICYFLDLVTTMLPLELDQTVCLKTAVLVTAIFCKTAVNRGEQSQYHFEYVCLKLSLYLLTLANTQNDNRILLTYVNRVGFLSGVLSASDSADESVACAALQLLSYVIHYFTKNNYQPKTVLQIQTHSIIKSLRRDSTSERGASVLQLVYMVLNCGLSSPLALAYDVGDQPALITQCNALRALMFRIQIMLCCRESKNQTLAGWKTLSSIFKHAIVTKNDTKLIAILTSQPWTHTLIHFQLTQQISMEFLTFLHNWLTLLKITIAKGQERNKIQFCKYSLVTKTLVVIKKNLVVDDELKEFNKKVMVVVQDILDGASIISK